MIVGNAGQAAFVKDVEVGHQEGELRFQLRKPLEQRLIVSRECVGTGVP